MPRAVVGDFTKGVSVPGSTDNRILAVDPGTQTLGYSCAWRGAESRLDAVAGSITVGGPYFDRIRMLAAKLEDIVRAVKPTHLVLEMPFVGKNARSAISLGEARGMILTVVYRVCDHNLVVCDYTPMQVRHALGLKAAANKTDVALRVLALVNLVAAQKPDNADATDALALAYCEAAALRWV